MSDTNAVLFPIHVKAVTKLGSFCHI